MRPGYARRKGDLRENCWQCHRFDTYSWKTNASRAIGMAGLLAGDRSCIPACWALLVLLVQSLRKYVLSIINSAIYEFTASWLHTIFVRVIFVVWSVLAQNWNQLSVIELLAYIALSNLWSPPEESYYSVSTKKYNGVVFEILGRRHWNFYNRI